MLLKLDIRPFYDVNLVLTGRLFRFLKNNLAQLAKCVLILITGLLLTACAGNKESQDEGAVAQQLRSQLNEWKGTPYRYGGTTKQGIDCSAFVQITYRDIFRKDLPRSTEDQARIGNKINKNNLQAGDLVFFKTGSGQDGYHVGIYAENNTFIHASTSKGVTRSSLSNSYWQEHYWHSRRVM